MPVSSLRIWRGKMRNTDVIMNDEMECLLEKLGTLETEVFISNLLREPFDYTEWQREHFAKFSLEELNTKAVQFAKEHPYKE
jgi:hypothetical protein